jgi:leader peptidase (prepilin peptidase)/N-methyltransferase
VSLVLGLEIFAAMVGGAIIGSFLTVLATRIPKLLLADEGGDISLAAILSGISWPGSHCTACDVAVAPRDNIPVLSYLLLGGKCRTCAAPYGHLYLVLEISTAIAAMLCVLLFGWTGEAAFCFALLALLLALTAIDLKEQLLPDILLLPLLPLGLWFQMRYRDGLPSALLGMAIGFLVMWTIGAVYRLCTGRDGMGFGDVKMAAVLGAWLGATAMPFFLLGAFATGVLCTLPLLVLGRLNAKIAVPFGPFLCLSAVVFVLIPSAASWTQAALFGL